MPHPIIAGADPRGDAAPVALAARLSEALSAPLVIVVAHTPPPPAVRGISQHYRRELRRAAEKRLEAVLEDLPEGTRGTSIMASSPAHALHDLAEEERAALLVVGSTHHGALGRIAPGSVTDRVLHGAPCPVAVAPRGWAEEPERPLRRIGVAFADTDEGRDALRGAAALARRLSGALHAFTAVEPLDWTDIVPLAGADDAPAILEQRRLAEQTLRRVLDELGPGLERHAEVLPDQPAQALVTATKELDLMICGSRGYGPLRAIMLGGVSRRLAREAHCPVVVIPRGTEGALEALAEGDASVAAS